MSDQNEGFRVVFAIVANVRNQRAVTQSALYDGMRLFTSEPVFTKALNGLVNSGVIDRHPSGVLRWVGPNQLKIATA